MNGYDEEYGPNKRNLCECCNKPLLVDEICFNTPEIKRTYDEE